MNILRLALSVLILSSLVYYSEAFSDSFFKATKECQLFSSIPKQENISDITTIIGKEYKINLDSKYFETNLGISVEGVYPENRWVNQDCGVIRTDEQFVPFFANQQTREDQPVSPTITKFDQQSLAVCGGWGNKVKSSDLEGLFTGKVLQYLYEELNHTVITKNANIDLFKKELIKIWSERSAFEHVVCGQPGRHGKNNLGGLHYVGRYLEVQNNNWGGLAESCQREQIDRPVYTLGVNFLTPRGSIATKCPSGYQYNMGVMDLIKEGTSAFKEQYISNKNGACIYSNMGVSYVFVARNNEIVTFYPKINPSGDSCSIAN